MKAGSTIRFRAAHRLEAGDIAALSRDHVEHGLRWRWTPARVRRQIDDPDTMVLVASREGEIAGGAIMHFGDRSAHLLLLVVAPSHRRSGIGSGLLRWLEKSCRTAGIERIRLEVRAGNAVARRFYQEQEFRVLGSLAGYYDRHEAAVILVKTLDSRFGAAR